MANIVADFTAIVANDKGFTLALPAPLSGSFPFALPPNSRREDPAILAFRVVPLTPGTAVTFQVAVNNLPVFDVPAPTLQFDTTAFRTVHEIINVQPVVLQLSNTITFKLLSGTGQVRFSDVVLWYRLTI